MILPGIIKKDTTRNGFTRDNLVQESLRKMSTDNFEVSTQCCSHEECSLAPSRNADTK